MRMSCLITTLNPMTEIPNPARLIQSLALIFIASPALIIEKGRARLTLFSAHLRPELGIRYPDGASGGTMRAHRCGRTPDTMRSVEMRKRRSEMLPKTCRRAEDALPYATLD
jgi:hypothetical protein